MVLSVPTRINTVWASISEIEATVCKASVGLGLGYGVGVEAGRAAIHMAYIGYDPVPVFAKAFHHLAVGESSGFDREVVSEGMLRTGVEKRLLSSIIAAPVCNDLIAAGISEITLKEVDFPWIVLGSALARGNGVCIAINNAFVRYDGIICGIEKGDISSLSCHGTLKMTTIKGERAASFITLKGDNQPGNVLIDAWQSLEEFAARCLVETSEEARLSDAGAGLLEED